MRTVDCIPYNRFAGMRGSSKEKLIIALIRCARFLNEGTMKPSEVIDIITEFVAECEQVSNG